VLSQPAAEDHFTAIQQRLRAYGASHYALESLNEEAASYRFVCKMAVPESSATLDFEAMDRDPLQAMAQVLAKVEAWRNQLSARRSVNDFNNR
jgi:hypothetical protein